MKYTNKIVLISIAVFLSSALSFAQNDRTENWCSSDQHLENMKLSNPTFQQNRQALEMYVSQFVNTYAKSANAKKATIIIPVVVHNITHSGGLGYVSKAQIEGQLNTLNEDFKRLNADTSNTRPLFAPYAGSIDIEFRLAHIDPNGDCTEGIVRLENSLSFSTSTNMAEGVKALSNWPTQGTRAYFNIWVIDEIESDGTTFVAGYAQFPGSNNNGTYGVVMADQSFGAGYRTLTHEIGHCFDLLHTFNYGSCSGGGDQCSDTPRVYESNFNCDVNRNTCTNIEPFYGADVVDQFENYMSYANCQNMFTQQQEARMTAILGNTNTNQGVAHLHTTTNKNNTGVNDPYGPVICAPIALFEYDKEYICEGASVNFTDQSYNATPTTWNWTFNGGTPSTSSQQNPTITYNTAGVYSVTHEPGTTAGTDLVTLNNIITVSSLVADYTGPFLDSYENSTQFSNDWRIENVSGGQTWQNTTSAAATGSRSVRIRNYVTNTAGEIDELISPSYDISTASNKTMTFKQAFAKKNSSSSDRLLVYYSIDCGATWNLVLPLTTSNLATAPDHTNEFIPTASEWVTRTVNLASIGSSTNVRFKFEFKSGEGNNIYIDDLNIGGSTGVDEFENIASFSVYPNPTTSNAKISFNLVKNVSNLKITVKNALGQNVTNVVNGQSFNTGKYTLNIDEQRKLAPGLYFIEFNADNNIKAQKFIIQ